MNAPPQHAMRATALRPAPPKRTYSHGHAWLCGHKRRVYFDLGGVYDVMDDHGYASMAEAITTGRIRGASLVTPQELGHTSRGVPVDVACATGSGTTSIAYIRRWARFPVRIETDSGRSFQLMQLTVGFVRRTTRLLILGQRSCTRCGYKTVEQQDDDYHRDRRGRTRHAQTIRSTLAMYSTTRATLANTATDSTIMTTRPNDSRAPPTSAVARALQAVVYPHLARQAIMALHGDMWPINVLQARKTTTVHWGRSKERVALVGMCLQRTLGCFLPGVARGILGHITQMAVGKPA